MLCRRAQCYGHVLRLVAPPWLLPALPIKILIFHSNCGRRVSAIQRWRARATARVQRGIHYNYARHLYHSLRPVNLPKQIPAGFVLFSTCYAFCSEYSFRLPQQKTRKAHPRASVYIYDAAGTALRRRAGNRRTSHVMCDDQGRDAKLRRGLRCGRCTE